MTAPYVTGTVSVTAGSAVVTGNGTGWQTGLVIGGLFGLDSANGNPVPILSIDSDTQLTLAKPWRGTTAANQAYWIVRDTAYGQQTVANAQALATYIQRLDNQSLASIAGLVPAADRLPYFTGANSAALTTLSAFARTLLDDANAAAAYATLGEVPDAQIPTRLRTQAIVEAELNAIAYNGWWRNGGTGADNPGVGYGNGMNIQYDGNNATQLFFRTTNGNAYTRGKSAGSYTAWRQFLMRDEILAAVAQAGGIPTGGIMDYGSNANGVYMRFANGLMACIANVSLAPDTAVGQIFVSADTPVNMPASFVSTNYSAVYSPQTGQRWGSARPTTTSQVYVRQWAPLLGTGLITGTLVAIGRWF